MVTGIILLVIAAIVVLIGTKESDAIVLYYDAEDVTPEMMASANAGANRVEDDLGDRPATSEVETEENTPAPAGSAAPTSAVRVTVGGAAVNSRNRPRSVESSLSEITQAARDNDPVDVESRARDMYNEIMRGGGL